MPKAEEGKREWVVELDVEGIAIVSVDADDAQEAISKALERAKPADVTELDSVEATRIAGPFASTPASRRLTWYRGPEKASKAGSRDGSGR
jgi:hypothetical protein